MSSSSRNNENNTRRRRRRRGSRPQPEATPDYPNVKFEGFQSIDIPANAAQSPVETHLSLISNPSDFRYLDEIALLKRGRIDRDAPKHPYNRYVAQSQNEPSYTSDSTSNTSNSSAPSATSQSTTDSEDAKSVTPMSAVTYLGGEVECESITSVGTDGSLKLSRLKEGGERYELTSGRQLAIFQQNQGQSALIIYKN